VPVADDYFDEKTVNRQRLLWTIATRRQLERWEPLVAAWIRAGWEGRPRGGADVWAAAIEHHFALVAARHLFHALDLSPPATIPVDPTLRAELIEGRDLHEHWRENLPIFMATPRPKEPRHRSGKSFAERNPDHPPYWWLSWSNGTGARLLPNVTAPAVHQLLDDVETEVLTNEPTFSEYVPPRARSPWLHQNGEWWPKPDDR
jgi:hypothetical protein